MLYEPERSALRFGPLTLLGEDRKKNVEFEEEGFCMR